jgi:hypothetical protein
MLREEVRSGMLMQSGETRWRQQPRGGARRSPSGGSACQLVRCACRWEGFECLMKSKHSTSLAESSPRKGFFFHFFIVLMLDLSFLSPHIARALF